MLIGNCKIQNSLLHGLIRVKKLICVAIPWSLTCVAKKCAQVHIRLVIRRNIKKVTISVTKSKQTCVERNASKAVYRTILKGGVFY